MSTLGTVERPLCVAVIGSGPSGFYAAEALLKAPNLTVRVDVFDRLPSCASILNQEKRNEQTGRL